MRNCGRPRLRDILGRLTRASPRRYRTCFVLDRGSSMLCTNSGGRCQLMYGGLSCNEMLHPSFLQQLSVRTAHDAGAPHHPDARDICDEPSRYVLPQALILSEHVGLVLKEMHRQHLPLTSSPPCTRGSYYNTVTCRSPVFVTYLRRLRFSFQPQFQNLGSPNVSILPVLMYGDRYRAKYNPSTFRPQPRSGRLQRQSFVGWGH